MVDGLTGDHSLTAQRSVEVERRPEREAVHIQHQVMEALSVRETVKRV